MLMQLKSFALAVTLLLSLRGTAQEFTKLDQWLENNVASMGGRAVLMVYKDGKVVYSHAANELSCRQRFMAWPLAGAPEGKSVPRTLPLPRGNGLRAAANG